MSANIMNELHAQGVSVWYDTLSREMLKTGLLKSLIDRGLRGQTSNPTIFQAAITHGHDYDEDVLKLARAGKSSEDICWELMVADVQAACDLFRPLYDATGGKDGFVSLELDPLKAHDTEGSLKQARELWPRVNRPNLMLKVPGTTEGLPCVEALLAEGMNINITLLFAVQRYQEVMEAHMRGLEARLAKGQPIDRIASVASFFVSRVDTEAEKRLDKLTGADKASLAGLKGTVAVANAQIAYEKFLETIGSARWHALAAQGAQVQRPLWASTSTKNPNYKDTIYVDELIGPNCVNTMPENTLKAIEDHGSTTVTLTSDGIQRSERILANLASVGVDLDDITLNTLVKEGVQKFADSYKDLLGAIEKSMKELQRV